MRSRPRHRRTCGAGPAPRPAPPIQLREASIGIRNSATASEASRLNTTVSPRSPNICPAMPSTNTIGKNTATVVRVDDTTALPTSEVPRTVAVM
jgi:hypothetical protein